VAGLWLELARVLQFAEHDAVGGAFVIALRNGEPNRAVVFMEGRILK
jgi:hypothetical protein